MKGNLFFSLKYCLQLFQDWADDNLMSPYCTRHHAGVPDEQDSVSTFKSLLDMKVVDCVLDSAYSLCWNTWPREGECSTDIMYAPPARIFAEKKGLYLITSQNVNQYRK